MTWSELLELGRLAFGGQTPGRNLEAELVEAFEHHPAEMHAAIVRLGERFTAGRVHSPWPLVLRELELVDGRLRVVGDEPADLGRLERLAGTWIRNAGLYEPADRGDPDESASLEDAIFGEHGPLRAFGEDHALRRRMVGLWRAERPRAARADRELLERAERNRPARPAALELDPLELSQTHANMVRNTETEVGASV